MKHLNRVVAAAATTVIALSGLTACSSGSDDPSASADTSSSAASTDSSATAPSASASKGGTETAKEATITIKDFKYAGPSSVAPGTKITVKNDDTEAHTVTADKGSAFDVKIDPGKSASFTAPTSAGSYDYHCTYHGNMHATLVVS
jgi:plastocyanin